MASSVPRDGDTTRPRLVGLPPPPGRAPASPPSSSPPAASEASPAARPFEGFKPIRERGDRSRGSLTPEGLTAIRDRHAARAEGVSSLRADLAIFSASFVAFLVVAIYLYYGLDLWNADSLSRTIDAQSVLSSRDPHLGAIGFVWPPLPTMARILLLPLTRPLGVPDFTGQLTSVLFAAGVVVVLHRILRDMGLPPLPRVLWMALALLNPVVVLHFANGTAESAFTLLILVVLYCALRLEASPLSALTGMGVAIALALLVRYEALAIAGTSALGVLLYSVADRRSRGVVRMRTEALLVALLVPVVFVGLMWLYFNWSIQGDALFFYTSPYSIRGAADVARNAPGHVLEYAMHSLTGTFRYVLERTLQVSALFIVAVAAIAWPAVRRRDPIAGLLLMVALSIHAIQAYQAFTGSIAPWLRYWVYLPLLTPILLGYVVTRPGWSGRLGPAFRRAVVMGVVPVLLFASSGVAFFAMQDSAVGYDEQIFAHVLAGDTHEAEVVRGKIPSKTLAEDIAAYLNQTDGKVLLDKQRAPLFILSINDPSRLIIDSDRDFEQILKEPWLTADWVLLPDPAEDNATVRAHDSIYMAFPDLYEGAPWLTLAHEFSGTRQWRLYRVVDPAAPPTESGAAATPTATPSP